MSGDDKPNRILSGIIALSVSTFVWDWVKYSSVLTEFAQRYGENGDFIIYIISSTVGALTGLAVFYMLAKVIKIDER